MLKIRSGIGYDIHRIEPGTGLKLGGILVADDIQFVAHSDGDVLIHAIIDSLLGVIGEKDIGEQFPDTDDKFKNIDSQDLLRETLLLVKEKQMEIQNVDCVVIAERPSLKPFKSEIKKNLTSIMNLESDDFNFKAKTKEKVGEVGRGEAIECFCVSLVRQLD